MPRIIYSTQIIIMRKLTILFLLLSTHFSSFSQICELVAGGEVTVEFANFSVTNVTENGSDCTIDYTLDYRVNNPNGCGVSLQAFVTTNAGSQTTFNVTADGAWHTETGTIFNTACTGSSTVLISGGWFHPCSNQNIPWPGPSCVSTNYTNIPEALPVELINFGAVENRDQVDLSWTTASEINNELFVIEHSNDGNEFREIGIIEGTGTTSSIQNYYFSHKQPSVGANYYRLKQVDYNGDFEYTNSIYIDIKYTGDIQVYPNPTNGLVNLKAPENVVTTVDIYNHSGTLMLSDKNIKDGNSISLDGLPVGWYILKFTTTQGVTVRRIHKI